MRDTTKETRFEVPASVAPITDDLASMILFVENAETPFAPVAADDGLDLTLATSGGGWRCDWLEGV